MRAAAPSCPTSGSLMKKHHLDTMKVFEISEMYDQYGHCMMQEIYWGRVLTLSAP